MITKLKSLYQHQGFMRYFTNTAWLFAEKVLRMVVGLFVGVWVARYLGPEQFGLLSYAQSFVGLFAAFATLGLDGIVVRELVKDETRRDELIGTAFWLKLMGALGVLGLLAIAINFTSNDGYTNILVFIIASATVFQAFNVVDMYFQAKVLSRFVVFANILSLFISSLVKIGLILYQAPLMAFAWAVLFDSFVLAAGFVYFYLAVRNKDHISSQIGAAQTNSSFPRKRESMSLVCHSSYFSKHISTTKYSPLLPFNKSTALALLKDSWSLILSGIVISIYMKIDQIMIKEMLDSESVGQYAAATRISETWYFIPTVVSGSLFPAIINAKKQSEELYYARLQRLYALMVWMAIAIALPMTFLSGWVIQLLYGSAYSQASNVLMIHIWAGINVSMGTVWSKWILSENRQVIATYGHIVGGILNIGLNLYFIRFYGIEGAALATLISSFLSAFFVYTLYRPKIAYAMFFRSIQLWRIISESKKRNAAK